MTLTLVLNEQVINRLDLAPGHAIAQQILVSPKTYAQQVQCAIDYPRALDDPRELSEIPEIRLWFLRWDAVYPWLPYVLDWRAGELARYAAMLVPHQFSQREGIQFNPEALEIFVMHKSFILWNWLNAQGLNGALEARAMAQVLGYELSSELFELLAQGA